MTYLDYSATTKISKEVLDEVSKDLFTKATNKDIKDYQNKIKNILNTNHDVIFTSGSSESNNYAIKGISLNTKKKEIITTEVEHSSITETLSYLKSQGFIIKTIPIHDGLLSLSELKKAITKDTALITITAVNSETGLLNPVNEIGKIAKENNIPFHCDMTQSIGKINIPLDNIDLISLSSHKFYGPKGIGLLLKKPNIKLKPLIYGKRNHILDSESIHDDILKTIYNHVADLIESHCGESEHLDKQDIVDIIEYVNSNLLKKNIDEVFFENKSIDEIIDELTALITEEYEEKIKDIPEEVSNEFEKVINLNVIDKYWMEQINTMAHLKEGIFLRQYAQDNPLRAYTTEGFELFDTMLENIDKYTTLYLVKAEIRQNIERKQVVKNQSTNDSSSDSKGRTIKKGEKIGRNQLCPCGSGKKYKNCCGK